MSPQVGIYTKADADTDIATHAAILAAHHRDMLELLRTGEYYPSPLIADGSPTGNVVTAVDKLFAIPYPVVRTITVDRIALNVTTLGEAGAKARLGIYKNGTNLYPGELLVDTGEIDCTGTGVKPKTIDQQLTRGLYWLSFITNENTWKRGHVDDHIPILGGGTTINATQSSWTVDHSYAALPDPFPAGAALTAGLVLVALRIASLD